MVVAVIWLGTSAWDELKAEEEGDKLNVKEVYGTCLLLLIAGHETTTRLIGNGMYTNNTN